MKNKKGLLFIVAMCAMMVLSGCSDKTSSDTFKLGVNLELSGEVSSYGNMELNGVLLAVEKINAEGGINGKEIEVIKYDNKSDQGTAIQMQTKLASEDKVDVIVGPATSGLAKAVRPISDEYGVPVIFASATADEVTNDGASAYEQAFRICFGDSFQGVTMANFASNNLNATKAVILRDSNDYGTGLADNFKSQFTTNGGTIVAEEVFNSGDTDFNAILTNIKNKGDFDVIFVPGYYTEAGNIIQQARSLGITQPILGADGFESADLVNIAGTKALNDVYYSTHYSSLSDDADLKDFMDSYLEKYGEEANTFNALAYDAAMLAFDAIKRSPDDITAALADTTSFKGVTGTIAIDTLHEAVKSAFVVGLVDGEATTAILVNP